MDVTDKINFIHNNHIKENVRNSDDDIYKYIITKYIKNKYDKKGKYIPLLYTLNKKLNKNLCINTIRFDKIIYEKNGIYLNEILSDDKYIIKFPIDKILTYLLNIFKYVKVLNKNNIIHLNIRPESILISDKRAKLTDFEYSIDANTIYTDKHTIIGIEWRCGDSFRTIIKDKLDYLLLPPELIINNINNDIQYIKNKYKKYYSIIYKIIDDERYRLFLKSKYVKYYNEFLRNFKKETVLHETDYTKIDIFSLGILLEELILTYINIGNIPNNVNSIIYDLINLTTEMKRICIKDRISIDEALYRYELLLTDMNNYKDIDNTINSMVNEFFL